jgi:hypothetical protein
LRISDERANTSDAEVADTWGGTRDLR